MDAGARYAFTTICQYVITAIGVIVAFDALGVRWSSLQWLIAALSVALGFGLQEIVANFVSGLIILFERPFRVGDIVKVKEVSGVVSRIRIRATTIIDWDRNELVVPNKRFITDELINSTLSTSMTRVVIPVGIAYGSDAALAKRLLLKLAQENPLVLDDPAPSALFLRFGDNSLDLELRVFLGNIKDRLTLTDELHEAINREFQQAGIEIVFPQRDVHLETTKPIEVRMLDSRAAPARTGDQ
ncbi:MAG: mechanosensitive ion channel [Planctomycetes bacterium]|nr:mechanosensitive ion channel [Planctomycetota bacterium]